MLDITEKLLEKMIKARLTSAIDRVGGLASNQHGFGKYHSTITGIKQVRRKINEA